MDTEMTRVRHEARGKNVRVDGWQEGTEDLSGFALVTDGKTQTTFAVMLGQSLAVALSKARARMEAGLRNALPRHKTKAEPKGGSGSIKEARTKGAKS